MFSVPKEATLRAKWKDQISKHQHFEDTLIAYPICEMHFDADKIVQSGKRKTLVKCSVPTIFPE